MEARVAKTCRICTQIITVGERLLPLPNSEGVVHIGCGTEHGIQPPVCRHWLKGQCLSGHSCFFRHAGEAINSDEPKLPKTRPKGSRKPRNDVNNKFRASVFRRFLWDAYGPQRLSQGSGVADIAGGKGVLAFELINLSQIPAFTLDLRPSDVSKQAKWLAGGFYHKVNPIFRGSVVRSLDECLASGPLQPPYVRMVLNTDVVDCICQNSIKHTPQELEPIENALEIARESKISVGHGDADFESDAPEDEEINGLVDPPEANHGEEITDASDICHRLCNASLFVGLHPDHATEAIVDLALSLNRPFAVVPCCVCARAFPGRRLSDGREVTKYDEFIEYLISKAPAKVHIATLQFEGRNTVLYCL